MTFPHWDSILLEQDSSSECKYSRQTVYEAWLSDKAKDGYVHDQLKERLNRALATCNTHLVQPQSRQCGLRMAADGLAFACCLSRHTPGLFQNSDFLRFPTTTARCGIWLSREEGGESFEAKMQRAMEVNNRAILNAVSTMMDQKLSDQKMSNEESAEAQLSEIKKLKTTKPTFERKGNEERYKFYLQATSGRASGRGEGSGEAGKVQKAVEELEKADSYVGA
ncbi:hypothetical protein Bbelb_334530 [Branchiostoma belcheri]|nr:hypothetical protein Bbelb_334530 [Branchiostoma belcheri]